MNAGADLHRLQAIIDASGVAQRIEALLPVGVRPRQLTVRTLLIGILITLADHRPAHLARIHKALIGLSEADRRRLGVIARIKDAEHKLTYRQLEYTFARVVEALSKQHPDGQPSKTLSEIMDGLLEGSVAVLGGGRVPQSSSLAIDWSDYESFACPPRKPREKTEAQRSAQPAPADTDAQEQEQHGEQQETQEDQQDEDKDDDGKAACAETEAAWGHRKVNHPSKSESFYGYYLQTGGCPKFRRTLSGGPPALSAPVGSVRGANQVREDRRNRHEEGTRAGGRCDDRGLGESAATASPGGAR